VPVVNYISVEILIFDNVSHFEVFSRRWRKTIKDDENPPTKIDLLVLFLYTVMHRASPAAGENSNLKTSYRRRYQTCFGILKISSLAERENLIPNQKNSGLEEERPPFIRGVGGFEGLRKILSH
jgi:hypothetical protein